MINLDGVVVAVTGAAGNIGRALCAALTQCHAEVIATDIVADPGDIAASVFFQHDVTDPKSWQGLAELVERRSSRLDALVNNAGCSLVDRFEDTSPEQFRQLTEINVVSVVMGMQAMLPLLRAGGLTRNGGSSVVNMSSAAGLKAAPFNSAYCTTKAAVAMLSKAAGAEFAAFKYNVRVNSVHPGAMDTRMLDAHIASYVRVGVGPDTASVQEGLVAQLPLGRKGAPAELGGVVAFLCSEASSYVTCTEVVVDGGFTGG